MEATGSVVHPTDGLPDKACHAGKEHFLKTAYEAKRTENANSYSTVLNHRAKETTIRICSMMENQPTNVGSTLSSITRRVQNLSL